MDVSILGGGPAGATCALVLARAGCRVRVIDRGDEGFRGGECLPPSALPILRRLDLEAALRNGPHLPCYANQSSWGAPELWETDFLRSPWGHGWHLDRPAFDRLLLERAESVGAEVRRPAHFVAASRREAGWSVVHRAADGLEESTTTRWIVDATGHARVWLRRQGVEVERADRQVARILAFAAPDAARNPDTRTLVEAAPHGWWYSAKIPGGRRMVMFFSDADLPALQELRDAASFLAALDATHHVAQRIRDGGYKASGSPITRTAASARAAEVTGEGWLSVGDAAISFDPLSSQGVVKALRGGEQAASALLTALAGDRSEITRYAASIDTLWREVRAERAKYYAMERRWAQNEFWRRRSA